MNKKKRLPAICLAVMLALLSVLPVWAASPYTAVTPSSGTAVTHTLKLTDSDALLYSFTYNYTVGDPVIVQPSSGIVNTDEAVSGKPTIAAVTFSPSDTPDTDKKITKNLAINWTGVSIKTPGTYRWPVTKALAANTAPEQPTNTDTATYLYVYVTDVDGTLTVSNVGFAKDEALVTKGNLEDTFAATVVDLSVSKTVTGDKGSKDQYFKFTINLTAPAGAAGAGAKPYNISGADASVPKTAYNNAATNPTSVSLTGGTAQSVDIWLKHGQTVKIEDLPFGIGYTVTESNNDGYTVATAVTGDTKNAADGDIATGNANAVTDTFLEADTTVAYTNNRTGTAPTGIFLQFGAPTVGIAFVILLFLILFVGRKRKEQV